MEPRTRNMRWLLPKMATLRNRPVVRPVAACENTTYLKRTRFSSRSRLSGARWRRHKTCLGPHSFLPVAVDWQNGSSCRYASDVWVLCGRERKYAMKINPKTNPKYITTLVSVFERFNKQEIYFHWENAVHSLPNLICIDFFVVRAVNRLRGHSEVLDPWIVRYWVSLTEHILYHNIIKTL